jgi:hypothetical protein
VLVEFFARNGTTGLDEWFTVGTLTGFVAYTSKHLRINPSTGGVSYNYLKKIRISVQGRAGGGSFINKFEYYPDGPNSTEQTYYVGRAGGNIFAPVAVRNAAGTSVTTIGPGTIRLGTGATWTALLRATKTIVGTNPETIWVTGAAVGDIVELSRSLLGEVTAPNTVTFNAGAVTTIADSAIVTGTYSQSALYAGIPTATAARLTDGDGTTVAATTTNTSNQWIEVLLAAPAQIVGLRVGGGNGTGWGLVASHLNGRTIQTWDGAAWVGQGVISGVADSGANQFVTIPVGPVTTDLIRIFNSFGTVATSEMIPIVRTITTAPPLTGSITAIVKRYT